MESKPYTFELDLERGPPAAEPNWGMGLSLSSIPSTERTTGTPPTLTPPLTEQEIQAKPWKYMGYRGYSEFIASDVDFLVLRRFSNVRIALLLQDQVTEAEEMLRKLDGEYSQRDSEDVNNGTFRDDLKERQVVTMMLKERLTEYSMVASGIYLSSLHSLTFCTLDSFVLQQSALQKFPLAAQKDLLSLKNWHYNHSDCAIASKEQDYLQHDLDLFSVAPREKTPLRRFLETSLWFRDNPLWKKKKAPDPPAYDRDAVAYISDTRINRFITCLIVFVGMAMLIAPMWVLQALDDPLKKLAVITAFLIVFLGLVSYATVARPAEILAATAG
jgi:hypothetical protein